MLFNAVNKLFNFGCVEQGSPAVRARFGKEFIPFPHTLAVDFRVRAIFFELDYIHSRNINSLKLVVGKFADDEFKGIDIAAMNVIKLKKDSANPEVYRKRMRKWDELFTKSGANSWTTLLDATKIEEFIYSVK